MGYGRRISNKLTLVQIDMDYRTVGKNRDINLGLVGDPGAILRAVLQAASGRIKQDKRQLRPTVDEEAHRRRSGGLPRS